MKAKQIDLIALLKPLAKAVDQIPKDVSDDFVAHIYPYGIAVKVADLRAVSRVIRGNA